MTGILPVMGLAKIGEALGLSKQRVDGITNQPIQKFPPPLDSSCPCCGREGRVWDHDAVYRWALEHGRPWTEPKGQQ